MTIYDDLRNLIDAYMPEAQRQAAMAECDRLGKANNDACDRIVELESERDDLRESRNHYQAERDNLESRPVLTWEGCEEEFYHVCGHFSNSSQGSFMGRLKSRLPAPTDSIRVPFSDEQIERMAVALRDKYCEHYGIKADGVLPDYYKDLIRAALAAGGLEPCAVPEYKPEDGVPFLVAPEAQTVDAVPKPGPLTTFPKYQSAVDLATRPDYSTTNRFGDDPPKPGRRPASVDPRNTNAHEERMLKWFTYDHLPPKLAAASAPWCELAVLLCHSTPPGPERTVALRKLLEGKDAAVRATLTPGG